MGNSEVVASAQRRRGRPQRLPVDATALGSSSLDAVRRMAWVLATSRVLGQGGGGPMSRSSFLARLSEHDVAADASRLSRWESGSQVAPTALVEAYERITGAPDGSFVAVQHLLARSVGAPAPSTPAVADDDLDDLVERACAGGAHGGEWLRLASALSRYERVFLLRSTWEQLAETLVGELTRSAGVAFSRRYEAAAVLTRHPASRRHVTRAVGTFVMDPDAQSVAPALSLLREVGDSGAGDLVLRLMGSENPVLRRAASSVAGSFAVRDAFGSQASALLEEHVGHELSRRSQIERRIDALDLVTELNADSYARVLAGTRHDRLRRQVVLARDNRELVEAATARIIAEAVATYAEAACQRNAHDPDQMLRRLVREALFHAQRERRNVGAALIAVSPYAGSVAHALLRLTRDVDELTAGQAWSVLRRLGHVVDRDEVASRTLAEERESVRQRGLVTIGLASGDIDGQRAADLADLASTTTTPAERHAAIFGLGLAGHPSLVPLAEHAEPQVAAAARWWSRQGASLHDVDVVAPVPS